jgi:hypothetical protein
MLLSATEDSIVGPGADRYLLSWIATATTASRAAKDLGGVGHWNAHDARQPRLDARQPLARPNDSLGGPWRAAWRLDLARVQLRSHGTGRHSSQLRENRRNGPCSL